MLELRSICAQAGVIVQGMKIQARSEQDTARVDLNMAGSIQRLLAAMGQFQANPDVKSVSATVVQP